MTAVFEPPPTWADPVIVDKVTGQSQFNPVWLKWFVDVVATINATGGGGGGGTQHNLTAGLQGGMANQYYHLTATEYANLLTSPVGANKGGTGVANNAASTITITGSFPLGITLSAGTNVALPTAGTLSTLAGVESLSNKTLVAPALGTPVSGVATNLTGTAAGLVAGSALVAPAGSLTGAALNATVTGSSLTSVGVLSALTVSGAAVAGSIRPSAAGGYLANDSSPGIGTTITTALLVGKTVTVKDGLITGFA